MKIAQIVTGAIQENAYIVFEEGQRECAIIDPGDDAWKINKALEDLDLLPTHILITHGHFDHIGAVGEICEKWGSKVYIHQSEADCLTSERKNLAFLAGAHCKQKAADGFLSEGDIVEIGKLKFQVYETPGHSVGGLSFYIDECIFTGDLLFYMSVGRTDFEGGSMETLLKSIKKISILPKDTIVYPGHGIETVLGFELENNPYLQGIRK